MEGQAGGALEAVGPLPGGASQWIAQVAAVHRRDGRRFDHLAYDDNRRTDAKLGIERA